MDTNTTLPVIQKSAEIPNSGDYQFLYEQGLESISYYSGKIWNNHNLGDPGVTILQSLCYALTELSYKTHLPIEDILTRSDGKIQYNDRFVKPQDILPTNPVTLIDFKKKLVDEIIELKQVYFNLNGSQKSSSFTPYLELKPSYLEKGNDHEFQTQLKAKVAQVFLDHQNLGQLFQPAITLSDRLLTLNGSIFLDADLEVEEFIATLIFQLNSYLSSYPIFQAYETLIDEGKTKDEIFDGPLLSGGFLSDDDFMAKRINISIKALMVLINKLEGVQSVEKIGLPYGLSSPNTTLTGNSKNLFTIPFDLAPYFDLSSFTDQTFPLEIIQNGRPVQAISESKVQYFLTKLIPVPLAPVNFDQYLPKGSYRDIKEYYSIQHHFPEIYELNKKYNKNNANPARAAKNKQLKAYLAIFEQIMANYLAQLSHLDDLFSFDSGRNIYQLAGKTYFFQDLYEVPGIQELLKDVKGYARQYQERSDYEDWKAYKRDNLNPYRQELMEAIESPSANLLRKNKILKHLLARFGSRYQSRYLSLNNPGYGNNQTAEVVQISETLKSFPLLSANRARSYFLPGTCTNTLFAGLELIADDELQLNSYYQGLNEQIAEALEMPETLTIIYYLNNKPLVIFGNEQINPKSAAPDKWVEIYQYSKLLMAFPNQESFIDLLIIEEELPLDKEIIIQTIKYFLDPYQYTLDRLIQQCKGFVFIDNLRLYEKFQFDWSIKLDKDTSICSQKYNIDQILQMLALLKSDAEMIVLPFGVSTFYINIKTEHTLRPIFKASTFSMATKVLNRLKEFRKKKQFDLQFRIFRSEADKVGTLIPKKLLNTRISAFFPKWVPLVQEKQYQKFVSNKLRSFAPLNTLINLYCIDQPTMDNLLDHYNCWMGDILIAKQEDAMPCLLSVENDYTWKIIQLLIDQQ